MAKAGRPERNRSATFPLRFRQKQVTCPFLPPATSTTPPDPDFAIALPVWRDYGAGAWRVWSSGKRSHPSCEFHRMDFGMHSGGADPGTFAHWQIALAYAKYLSPKFHMACNDVIRAHMEGARPPKNVALTKLEGTVAKLVQVTGDQGKRITQPTLARRYRGGSARATLPTSPDV
jgi:hypothetical protein